MATAATWQSSVGFSERMATTIKIATSYKSAFPERTTPESQVEARAIESVIYRDAPSKEQYYRRCNDKIDEYNHLALPPDDEDPPEPEAASAPQESGLQIGPYTNCIHHTTGLFSTIYKTQHSTPTGPQTLAIKLTTPSQCQPPHDSKREARLLLAAKHPNVISLLKTHSLSSHFLLVFPFQPLDLETLLRKTPPSPPAAKEIVHDLFTALAHLHSLEIIHRDIKPSNILLASPTGPAYLADFGIAWSPHDPASETADQKITDVGTTCYRAPELLFGQKAYTTAIDLWAAGCVVAEIVHALTTNTSTTNNKTRGEWTLFNAGALGSELALLKSIFETLGTPTEKTWPEVISLPDWNKMTFVDFPRKTWDEILPHASPTARDIVGGLVRYQSTERMIAADVARLETL